MSSTNSISEATCEVPADTFQENLVLVESAQARLMDGEACT